MVNPFILSHSPNKHNIKYSVVKKNEELKANRVKIERTIIFCRTYDSTGRIYCYFKYGLGREFTQPIGVPNLPQFRLVDMFSACTNQKLKLNSFSVFFKQQPGAQHIDSTIRAYCRNKDKCRRELLFTDFDDAKCSFSISGCKCCDVCSAKCSCNDCTCVN